MIEPSQSVFSLFNSLGWNFIKFDDFIDDFIKAKPELYDLSKPIFLDDEYAKALNLNLSDIFDILGKFTDEPLQHVIEWSYYPEKSRYYFRVKI